MKRAVMAAFGGPANLQEDAVYPYIEVDKVHADLRPRPGAAGQWLLVDHHV
jgi:hypothetical protein